MSSSPSFTVPSSAEDLRYAARTGDIEQASAVLQRYTNSTDDLSKLLPAVIGSGDSLSGNKALHFCAANGHVNLIKLLIKHNADVNTINSSGSTPLHYASLNGQKDAVQSLLDAGANPVVENNYGKTALDEARMGGRDEIATLLMRFVEKTGDAPDLEKEEKQKDSNHANKTEK